MEFDENGQSHGKVMEFYFLGEKNIKMTIAVWLKIKRLENESKRSYLLSEKGHGFFIIWSWKVMEKSWNLIVWKVQEP